MRTAKQRYVCSGTDLCWLGRKLELALERAEKKHADVPTPENRRFVDYCRKQLDRHIRIVCPSESCLVCEGAGVLGVGETGVKDCWKCKGLGVYRRQA